MPVDDQPPASAPIVDQTPEVIQSPTIPNAVIDYPRERGSAAAVDTSTGVVAAPAKGKKTMSASAAEQRRRKWRWAGHVTRMCDRRWTKLLLDWIPTGRRRVGRPTMRWEDTLEEYAKKQLDGQNWTTVAKTREMWRQLEDGFVMYG